MASHITIALSASSWPFILLREISEVEEFSIYIYKTFPFMIWVLVSYLG